MGTAPDGFAVGIENHQFEIRKSKAKHQRGQALAQQLHGRRHRRLAEMPARIGKSSLDAEAPAPAHIGGVVRIGQTVFDHLDAAFEGLGGFEQGRDVQLVGDPEQPGEVKSGQQREGGLAFRDQEADGRRPIDIFQDLGAQHE